MCPVPLRNSVALVVAPHRPGESIPRTVATKVALSRLRRVTSNAELADQIPLELCRAGFGRVLFSLIQNNNWVVRSAHATGDDTLGSALLEAGRAHPRRLCQPLPESAMIRTKTPILVDQPQSDPRVYSELVAVVKSAVYVAAPVYVWQTPVALLHADAPGEDGDVGPEDRDLLGVFAEGLGAIMERNLAVDRMRALHQAASEHLGAVDSFATAFDAELPTDPGSQTPTPTVGTTDDISEQLTRRELQVLNLLAAGKTNAQIAGRLFISEGTAKSHIRHILHKLGASNRTEAVARYRNLTSG